MFKFIHVGISLVAAINRHNTSDSAVSGVSHTKIVQIHTELNPSTGQIESIETTKDLTEDLKTGRKIYNESTRAIPSHRNETTSSHHSTSNPIILEISELGEQGRIQKNNDLFSQKKAESFFDMYENDAHSKVTTIPIFIHTKQETHGNFAIEITSFATTFLTMAAFIIL
ncbi:hypothetical protein PAEPH01_1409 [Pancytospora epiphaga]|nr:hypothetical protein PAEPH01_1409 [Pancytospora epiphaga]